MKLQSIYKLASLTPQHRALLTALLGFFIITLDAIVVSVALPAIRDSLGGGITGLQWVMDGYTLPFAAILLLAGTLADRFGAKQTFGFGLIIFIISSIACAAVPSITLLIAARITQGIGAALMSPASLSIIGQAFPEPAAKARAIGYWAVGGAVASTSGPFIGGVLSTISWQLIFLINVPVGLFALWMLNGIPASVRRYAPFDWIGQFCSIIALTALTFAVIEAGEAGLVTRPILIVFIIALFAGVAFFIQQLRAEHPMVPLGLFRPRAASITVAIGFAFMFGFFGMVFVVSLYLQLQRGLTPFQTGLAFVPVTGFSVFMPIIAARLADRFGAWAPIVIGQALMVAGLFALGIFGDFASVSALVAMMIPVGIGAGTAMPSATSLLLNTVPHDRAGTASGVLNTSRQIGGAVAIAAFGALIAATGFHRGMSISLAIAASLLTVTMLATFTLRQPNPAIQGESL